MAISEKSILLNYQQEPSALPDFFHPVDMSELSLTKVGTPL